MSATRNKTAATLGLVAALGLAHAAVAQTPAKAPATSAAPAAQAQQVASPESLFAMWDKDNNKMLSLDEFRDGWKEVQVNMALRKLHENFVAMDTNHDDKLDAAEYANLGLVKKAGASAPPLSAFDTNKDQRLDFKEYIELVTTMLKNQH